MKSYSVKEISEKLNGELVGFTSHNIFSPEQLELASNDQISFIGNKKYEKLWADSKASVAVVNTDIA